MTSLPAAPHSNTAESASPTGTSESSSALPLTPQSPIASQLPKLSEDELLEQVLEASELQQAGQTEAAIALYQMLTVTDPDGHYGATARKALETLQEDASPKPGVETAPLAAPARIPAAAPPSSETCPGPSAALSQSGSG